jgi:hypothetical protein
MKRRQVDLKKQRELRERAEQREPSEAAREREVQAARAKARFDMTQHRNRKQGAARDYVGRHRKGKQ